MAEIPALFHQRPIVLRQSRTAMYHPFVDSLSLTLVDIPITASILIVFAIVLYFLVDLNRTAGNFLWVSSIKFHLSSSSTDLFRSIFLLFIFSMSVTMKSWFRTLAAVFNDPAPAQTFAGLSILLLVLYTGYTIPQPSMIGALRWITWINVSGFFALCYFFLWQLTFLHLPLHSAIEIWLRSPDPQWIP